MCLANILSLTERTKLTFVTKLEAIRVLNCDFDFCQEAKKVEFKKSRTVREDIRETVGLSWASKDKDLYEKQMARSFPWGSWMDS